MSLVHAATSAIKELVAFVGFNVRFVWCLTSGSLRALVPAGILPKKSVKGKVCLITGSASGVGRLCAIRLGATVVLWDINEAGNEETLSILEGLGCKAYAYTVNLADKEDVYKKARRVQEEVGDVYLLLNNAAIVNGKHLQDLTDSAIELTMNVNVLSLFYVTKAFLPRMLEKDEGHIATMGSIAGHAGLIGLTDYCASKHATIGFMASLYRELYSGGTHVQTTTISPYYINTGMFDGVTNSKLWLVCPILEPEYVANRIVDAILTNTPHLILPRFLYIIKFMGSFLPQSAIDAIYDYTGTDATMHTFKGRKVIVDDTPKAA